MRKRRVFDGVTQDGAVVCRISTQTKVKEIYQFDGLLIMFCLQIRYQRTPDSFMFMAFLEVIEYLSGYSSLLLKK